jgi:hypothetical protein
MVSLFMQDGESRPEQTSRVTAVNSSYNWRRTAIAIVVTATVTGASGYLLGIRTNQNIPQSTQRVTFQPSPTIAIQPSVSTPSPSPTQATPIPTLSMKIYRNERLGFEFKYPEYYELIGETTNGATFGSSGIPYLTISINQITNYKNLEPCEYSNETNEAYRQIFPCLERGGRWGQKGDIIETKLGRVAVKSFYIAEGFPDANYHIVQTSGSPKLEAKMYVSGGGLDPSFTQMLSTFKILDSK